MDDGMEMQLDMGQFLGEAPASSAALAVALGSDPAVAPSEGGGVGVAAATAADPIMLTDEQDDERAEDSKNGQPEAAPGSQVDASTHQGTKLDRQIERSLVEKQSRWLSLKGFARHSVIVVCRLLNWCER